MFSTFDFISNITNDMLLKRDSINLNDLCLICTLCGSPCIFFLLSETSWRSSASHIPRTDRSASLCPTSKRPLVQSEKDFGGNLGRQDQVQVSYFIADSYYTDIRVCIIDSCWCRLRTWTFLYVYYLYILYLYISHLK